MMKVKTYQNSEANALKLTAGCTGHGSNWYNICERAIS